MLYDPFLAKVLGKYDKGKGKEIVYRYNGGEEVPKVEPSLPCETKDDISAEPNAEAVETEGAEVKEPQEAQGAPADPEIPPPPTIADPRKRKDRGRRKMHVFKDYEVSALS